MLPAVPGEAAPSAERSRSTPRGSDRQEQIGTPPQKPEQRKIPPDCNTKVVRGQALVSWARRTGVHLTTPPVATSLQPLEAPRFQRMLLGAVCSWVAHFFGLSVALLSTLILAPMMAASYADPGISIEEVYDSCSTYVPDGNTTVLVFFEGRSAFSNTDFYRWLDLLRDATVWYGSIVLVVVLCWMTEMDRRLMRRLLAIDTLYVSLIMAAYAAMLWLPSVEIPYLAVAYLPQPIICVNCAYLVPCVLNVPRSERPGRRTIYRNMAMCTLVAIGAQSISVVFTTVNATHDIPLEYRVLRAVLIARVCELVAKLLCIEAQQIPLMVATGLSLCIGALTMMHVRLEVYYEPSEERLGNAVVAFAVAEVASSSLHAYAIAKTTASRKQQLRQLEAQISKGAADKTLLERKQRLIARLHRAHTVHIADAFADMAVESLCILAPAFYLIGANAQGLHPGSLSRFSSAAERQRHLVHVAGVQLGAELLADTAVGSIYLGVLDTRLYLPIRRTHTLLTIVLTATAVSSLLASGSDVVLCWKCEHLAHGLCYLD